MEKQKIRDVLCEAYEKVFGKEIPDDGTNLLSPSLGNRVAAYLYWFDLVEKKLGVPVVDLLGAHAYTVMSVENLTDAIYETVH